MEWCKQEFPTCYNRYGLPLYSAAWVKGEAEGTSNEWTVLLGGGGGRRDIPSSLFLSKFRTNPMSLLNVCQLDCGEVPYRITVYPAGNFAFGSFPSGCRRFDVENGSQLTGPLPSPVLTEVAGLQLALAFNSKMSLLAAGGEDGHLRLFDWSNDGFHLKSEQMDAHPSVKDLSFSDDGMLLASLGSNGCCRVWKTDQNELVPADNVPRKNDEIFGFCRFSNKVLFLTSIQGQHRKIVAWNCEPELTEIDRKTVIVSDPISAFDISPDGKLLAVGTIEGDIVILRSPVMSLLTVVKRAHSGTVTALAFNKMGLLSTSVDATARVILIKQSRSNGFILWALFFAFMILLLAILVCHFNGKQQFSILSFIFPSLKFDNRRFKFGACPMAMAGDHYGYAPT